MACNCGDPGCSDKDPGIEKEIKKMNEAFPTFAVGNVAVLVSGGPPMTVVKTDFREEVSLTQCAWFTDDGMLQLAVFPSATLKRTV